MKQALFWPAVARSFQVPGFGIVIDVRRNPVNLHCWRAHALPVIGRESLLVDTEGPGQEVRVSRISPAMLQCSRAHAALTIGVRPAVAPRARA